MLLALPSIAQAAQKVEWKNLLPQLPPLQDPLSSLTQDQRFDIETIAWAREMSDEERLLPLEADSKVEQFIELHAVFSDSDVRHPLEVVKAATGGIDIALVKIEPF